MSTETTGTVGVLHIVYHRSTASPVLGMRYLSEAANSSRRVRRVVPQLAVALATNLHHVLSRHDDVRAAWTHVISMHVNASERSMWLPRLRALADSPFRLTLALDSSVTVCSSLLHDVLRQELVRNRLDFAFNFEHSPLTPRSSVAGYRSAFGLQPRAVEEVMPHLFAMLARKGAGLTALLERWAEIMKRFPTMMDQIALRRVLLALRARNHTLALQARSGTRSRAGERLGRGTAGHVRIWRLAENVAAFKSADKLVPVVRLGAAVQKRREQWTFPRYTRPIHGPLLALHSYIPGSLAGDDVCEALDASARRTRLLLHLHPRQRVLTPQTRGECLAAVRAASPRAHGRNFSLEYAERICSLLPAQPRAAPRGGAAQLPLVESLDDFWAWMRAHRLVRAWARPTPRIPRVMGAPPSNTSIKVS